MMKNHARSYLSVFLILILLVGRLPVVLHAEETTAIPASSLSKNEKTRHVVCTELSDQARAYYTGSNTYENLILLDGKKTTDSTVAIGSPLFNRLQGMMQDVEYVTYTSLVDYWEYTDASAGSAHAWYFYDDLVSTGTGQNDENREHVWPQSHGNFQKDGAGTDLHHLRPSLPGTNSTRGNYTMGNVRAKNISGMKTRTNSQNKTILWYAPTYSDNECDGLVEVLDEVKGDVARIYLYVYVAYGNSSTNKNLFTTCSAYGANSNDGKKVIESLETLLEWNALDPVDEWEMRRNDLCQDVQGNRNIFIDYPELAWYLFELEDEMPEMQTPSGHAAAGNDYKIEAVSSDINKGTVSISGQVITASPKQGYYTAGYEVIEGSADVVQNGNNFYVTPHSDCKIRILFSEKTKVTLTYMVNGALFGTAEVYQGESMTLPTGITSPEGWAFAGWVTGQVERTDEKPSAIYTTTYTPTGNATLYALFTQEEEGGGTGQWTKLTALDQLSEGTQVVFACQQYESVAGALVSGKTWLEQISCKSFSDSKITNLPDTAMVFTLGGRPGAWTFTSSAGQLYCSAAKSLNFSGTGIGTWTIALNSGNTVVGSTNTSYGNLEYNASSPRFTTYLEGSNQKKIQLYYLAGGNTIYYSTEPDPHVLEKPVITAQSGDLRIGAGQEALFTVTAEGEELSYQWYYSEDGGAGWNAVSGDSGKTAAYSFTAEASQNGYKFYCVVSNDAGSVESEPVTLTIVEKPVITKQPKSTTTAVRKMVSLKVAATGSGLKYQWYYSKDGGATFTKCAAISGRTSKLAINVKDASYNGYLYYCEVTNEGGTIVTKTVKLTVISK